MSVTSSRVSAWLLFLVIVVPHWTSSVTLHEQIYLLGPHRVADPQLLARDFTWSTLPPTSWLFDHLLAPLWLVFDEFAIANIGRFGSGLLLTWSLLALARALRIPPLGVVAGVALWILWGQTLAYCGSPLEGFQVKSFSYPLMFFSLAWAMRGQMVRAGLAAGLGTAFHIIVGGLGCLALTLALLVQRKSFTYRQVALFLLGAVPLILPLLIGVALFHDGGASAAERAQMDEIYVRFASPHCCDIDWYMTPGRWARAGIIFLVAPLLIFTWPERRQARLLGWFVCMLILFFGVGVLAQRIEAYGVLKLFPGQLAKALPALFAFIFFFAWVATRRTERPFARWVQGLVLVAVMLLIDDRDVTASLARMPVGFVRELRNERWGQPREHRRISAWIRENTPQDSIFITPMVEEFWPYAQRAQVASMRHPPFDRKLIEWKERLEAQNGFKPFAERGWLIADELETNEAQLTVPQLRRLHELYGATHYLTLAERSDLAEHRLFSTEDFYVYDLKGLF